MIMNVVPIDMCANDKGVFAFEKSLGELITDPVCFLGCHFSRLEGLAELISDYIMLLLTSGSLEVNLLAERELSRRSFRRALKRGNQFSVRGLFPVHCVVSPLGETFENRFSTVMVHRNDSGRCYRIHLRAKEKTACSAALISY